MFLSILTFPLIKKQPGLLLSPCLMSVERLFLLLLVDVLQQRVSPDGVTDVGPAEDRATVRPKNTKRNTLTFATNN